jgi:uncharacterized protein (DUF3084 family)
LILLFFANNFATPTLNSTTNNQSLTMENESQSYGERLEALVKQEKELSLQKAALQYEEDRLNTREAKFEDMRDQHMAVVRSEEATLQYLKNLLEFAKGELTKQKQNLMWREFSLAKREQILMARRLELDSRERAMYNREYASKVRTREQIDLGIALDERETALNGMEDEMKAREVDLDEIDHELDNRAEAIEAREAELEFHETQVHHILKQLRWALSGLDQLPPYEDIPAPDYSSGEN